MMPLAIYPVIALGTLGIKQCNTGINARMSSAQYSVRSMSIGTMSVGGGAAQCKVKTWSRNNLKVKTLNDIPRTLANPSKIRNTHVKQNLHDAARERGVTIATASVKKNNQTYYYLAVSGSGWKKTSPNKITINGNEYQIVREAPKDVNVSNNKHSELKLMSHLEKNYSGDNAKIDIAIENNSIKKPGMCSLCQNSADKFADNNTGFDINIYHGSTRTTP